MQTIDTLMKIRSMPLLVLVACAVPLQAQPYFQYPDAQAAQQDFGYPPSSGNPWALPAPSAAPAYGAPPVPEPQQDAAISATTPAGERFVSEEEIRRLDRLTRESGIWHDDSAVQGDAYWPGPSQSRPATDGDTWGWLDADGLVGDHGGYRPRRPGYPPYNLGVPGAYPLVPGWNSLMPGSGQMFYPDSARRLTMPRLDTRVMDGINSGSYMNNSIAPFLY